MVDSYRVVSRPSLDDVLRGMRHMAWLGAANPQAVAVVNQRLRAQRQALDGQPLTPKRVASAQRGAWLAVSAPEHGAIKVRKLVEEICANLQAGDYASEILACYYWVHQNIRYMRDPWEVELVKEPRVILETRAGDCDDISVLLAAMLMACGNECRFILISFTPDKVPSHVFCAVKTPQGYLTLDPVANRVTNGMFAKATRMVAIPAGPG